VKYESGSKAEDRQAKPPARMHAALDRVRGLAVSPLKVQSGCSVLLADFTLGVRLSRRPAQSRR
jgi:hypothetical protein